MRIAIPDFPDPDSFADNVAYTLREMGHEVVMPGERSIPRAWRTRYERLRAKTSSKFVTSRERWLIEACRQTKIDLVLALTQAVSAEVLEETRRRGVRFRAAWWGDAPANMERLGLLSDQWDLICLKDPDAVRKFRCVGLPAFLLHEAMNPAWHKPVACQCNHDVVVAGNYYGYRQFLIRRLLANGVQVAMYGTELPAWAWPELKPIHRHRYIRREEKSRVFGEGLACLNSTSLAEGNSLNCRAFEIAGAGGLQLVEARPILPECFEPGREVLTYATVDDVIGHLTRVAQDEAGARRIRQAAAKRAVGEHTYRHRLTRMFALLEESA